MKIADFPSAAEQTLRISLDRYPTGVGGVRLRRKGIELSRLNARGVLAETRLGREDLNRFLSARGEALDAFFTRLRILLFEGDKPIGSAGLLRADSGTFQVEHVTLGGGEEIVEGLRTVEEFSESATSEARLIQIPQIYLSSLTLVRNGELGDFLVLTPPYPDGVAARAPSAFRQFVGQLLEEHQGIFAPA